MKHIKYYPQMTYSECGLCCAAMIAEYYNCDITFEDLRKRFPTGRNGLSIRKVVGVLEQLGIKAKVFKVKAAAIPAQVLPCIAYWKDSHYVVIERIDNANYHIIDPGMGDRILSHEDLELEFSGIIIVPVSDPKTAHRKIENLPLLMRFIFTDKKTLMGLAVTSVISYVFSFLIASFIRYVTTYYDSFSMDKIVGGIAIVAIFLGSAFVSQLLMTIHKNIVLDKLYKHIYRKLLKLDYSFFENRSVGVISYSLDCVEKVNDIVSDSFMTAIISFGAFIAIAAYMCTISVDVLLFTLAIIAAFSFAFLLVSRAMVRIKRFEISNRMRLYSIKNETISMMEGIKVFALEKYFFSSWENNYNKTLSYNRRLGRCKAVSGMVTSFCSLVLPLSVFLYGITKCSSGTMQLGTAMALYSIASMLSSHILAILQSSENIYVCRDYLFHLADIESQDVEMSGELEMGDFASLALHDVSFRYGNEMKNAISNINLSIEKGQKVAIIGSSGSGKSTLAKVLVKLYAPTTGEILINDTNVNELDNQSLRKRIVMVPQTGRIFNKTIKDNIFLDSSMEGESIETLLEMVCLTDDISNMAMRYNTTLSENGANISGGQRQKILIARALASCPQVLVLDEATCAMDYLSEKKIYENLKKRSITQIIITHRLNTIIDADEIYVMEKGELVEHGNHEELMQMQGTYYRLYSEGNE